MVLKTDSLFQPSMCHCLLWFSKPTGYPVPTSLYHAHGAPCTRGRSWCLVRRGTRGLGFPLLPIHPPPLLDSRRHLPFRQSRAIGPPHPLHCARMGFSSGTCSILSVSSDESLPFCIQIPQGHLVRSSLVFPLVDLVQNEVEPLSRSEVPLSPSNSSEERSSLGYPCAHGLCTVRTVSGSHAHGVNREVVPDSMQIYSLPSLQTHALILLFYVVLSLRLRKSSWGCLSQGGKGHH